MKTQSKTSIKDDHQLDEWQLTLDICRARISTRGGKEKEEKDACFFVQQENKANQRTFHVERLRPSEWERWRRRWWNVQKVKSTGDDTQSHRQSAWGQSSWSDRREEQTAVDGTREWAVLFTIEREKRDGMQREWTQNNLKNAVCVCTIANSIEDF